MPTKVSLFPTMHFPGNFDVLIYVLVHVIHLMHEAAARAGAQGALIQIVFLAHFAV